MKPPKNLYRLIPFLNLAQVLIVGAFMLLCFRWYYEYFHIKSIKQGDTQTYTLQTVQNGLKTMSDMLTKYDVPPLVVVMDESLLRETDDAFSKFYRETILAKKQDHFIFFNENNALTEKFFRERISALDMNEEEKVSQEIKNGLLDIRKYLEDREENTKNLIDAMTVVQATIKIIPETKKLVLMFNVPQENGKGLIVEDSGEKNLIKRYDELLGIYTNFENLPFVVSLFDALYENMGLLDEVNKTVLYTYQINAREKLITYHFFSLSLSLSALALLLRIFITLLGQVSEPLVFLGMIMFSFHKKDRIRKTLEKMQLFYDERKRKEVSLILRTRALKQAHEYVLQASADPNRMDIVQLLHAIEGIESDDEKYCKKCIDELHNILFPVIKPTSEEIEKQKQMKKEEERQELAQQVIEKYKTVSDIASQNKTLTLGKDAENALTQVRNELAIKNGAKIEDVAMHVQKDELKRARHALDKVLGM